jgi:hypothetical protein
MNASNSRGKAKTGPPTQTSKSRDACQSCEAGNSTQEANYSRGTINIRDDYSNRDNRYISKTARSDIRKANNSRDASNIQQERQQQQQELAARTLATFGWEGGFDPQSTELTIEGPPELVQHFCL